MFSLEGKKAIVTGAARGIGKVIAEKIAELGASVSLADVNKATLDETVNGLKSKGLKVIGVIMDVRDNNSIRQAIEETASAFGGLDIIVNNAGILGGIVYWMSI